MTLSEQDAITYLANAIRVARADGRVSPEEIAVAEKARDEIGARKAAFKAALYAAEAATYVPTPVGSYATKISNLAHMFAVALADGELSPPEEEVILRFASAIRVTAEQRELLRREAVARFGARSK